VKRSLGGAVSLANGGFEIWLRLNSRVIGRDQPEPIGEALGDGESREPRGGREPACDHLAP